MKISKIESFNGNGLLIALAICLIAFAIFGRLLPHPPNFAPIAAVAIFGGAILPARWALSLPLAAMVFSDIFIGMHALSPLTWGCFALIALLSHFHIKDVKPLVIAGASLGASVLFYLVTNFGVWLQGKMYPMTLPGLLECYYQAIPFFRNTLMGDLVFTAMLFGLYAIAVYAVTTRRPQLAK